MVLGVPLSVSPPLSETPVNENGDFSSAWGAHLEDQADSINQIGSVVAQIGVGVVDGSQATAGDVGEVMAVAIASGSAVALATGAAKTVASLSLTAGDWDVWGTVGFKPTATTSFRSAGGGLSLTPALVPDMSSGCGSIVAYSAQVPAASFGFAVGVLQVNVAATTVVYLSAYAAFTASTCGAYGFMRARRVR